MRYDYIFSGMGLSSLMILHKMIQADLYSVKTILIIEPEWEKQQDKTWCFWEKGESEWDFLVKKSWKDAYFVNESVEVNCFGNKYVYKMIESKRFYDFVLAEIAKYPNIQIINDKVTLFEEKKKSVLVITENGHYESAYFFNSVLNRREIENKPEYPLLQQHFTGWFVRTESSVFDAGRATFMDFSINQKGNTRFMYVLPLSAHEALVEYTLFSPDVLKDHEYEAEITDYLTKRGIVDFQIQSKEKGNIPMTAYPFWNKNSKRILHIGTAGGWTKASTGYTFKNCDKLSDVLVERLKQKPIDFTHFKKADKFAFYDKLLVKVLFYDNQIGSRLFSRMFTGVNSEVILKFLDEESTLWEDLKVIMSCPKWPFIKALFKS